MPLAATLLPPPLREGDRLTRGEFLRRWEAMPDLKFAELVDGIVHMASPVSPVHGRFHYRVGHWLGHYTDVTPACDGGGELTWQLEDGNVRQPDLALFILPEYGGQAQIVDGYYAGAAELVVEISYSTRTRDAGTKLRLYERSGVREYLIVRPDDQRIVWRELVDGKYREIPPGADGLFRSSVFPGLWLDSTALWTDDRAAIADAVRRGTSTTEHAVFMQKPAAAKR